MRNGSAEAMGLAVRPLHPLHRGRPFDETQHRDLRRVTTQDAACTMTDRPDGCRRASRE